MRERERERKREREREREKIIDNIKSVTSAITERINSKSYLQNK